MDGQGDVEEVGGGLEGGGLQPDVVGGGGGEAEEAEDAQGVVVFGVGGGRVGEEGVEKAGVGAQDLDGIAAVVVAEEAGRARGVHLWKVEILLIIEAN